jgi:serine/threonine protein kinase
VADIYDYEPLFGSWKIEKRLGGGTYGEVYEVSKAVMGIEQRSAVKRIPISNEGMLKSIETEIRAMLKMKGAPNVVAIEEFEIKDWKRDVGRDALIRMELLDGLDTIFKKGSVSEKEVAKLGIDICRALELCAKYNTLHRGIKPSNILVSSHGDYKLGDFGIAKRLGEGATLTGAGEFMAPEVFNPRGRYDLRADIYSLGITMYYLLNGHKIPFEGDSGESPIVRRIGGEAIPPLKGVGSELSNIMLKACAFKPDSRFSGPGEMRAALENIGRTFGGVAGPSTPIDEIPPPKNEEERGNSVGNIVNFGMAAIKGEWVYYKNYSDGKKLYKIRVDGSGRKKLNEDIGWFINVVGEWVYYTNYSDGKKLYKTRVDGTGRQKLNEDISECINVVGEWVYYKNWSDGSKLYKIRVDGSGRQKLNEDDNWFINVVGEWVYYTNGSDGFKLYKIRTDGSGRQKLNEDSSSYINVVGEWVYYVNSSDGDKLYKIRVDVSGRQKLNEDRVWYINVVGEWVYYRNTSDDGKLYKIRVDGTGRQNLNADKSEYINVVGEWVYYVNDSDDGKRYKIRMDGTGRQPVE